MLGVAALGGFGLMLAFAFTGARVEASPIADEVAQEIRAYYLANDPLPETVSPELITGLDMDESGRGYNSEFESVDVETVTAGTINFNGKRLPAAIIKTNITYVNRAAGTRKTLCYFFYQADDDEFQMHRSLALTKCDGSKLSAAETSMAEWKGANDFKP